MVFADNLKAALVVAVIVGHVTIAWIGLGGWVLSEPVVGELLLTVLRLVALVGTMFAMAAFFLLAGIFTPASFARKGLRRFAVDRAVRLGVPILFFMVVLAPVVEYVDTDSTGWRWGFPAFAVQTWVHPAPGPTWFLGVLLVLSVTYAIARTLRPAQPVSEPVRARVLVATAAAVAVLSYLIRLGVPFGQEVEHLALGQSPAWVAGFALGVVGAERGWFDRICAGTSRRLFRIAWSAAAVVVIMIGAAAMSGADVTVFFGGGTWPSLLLLLPESVLVVTMPIWLFDVFRRRADRAGRLMREADRAAFAAFLVHQIVAVGAVLATRYVDWPVELEYLAAAAVAVLVSFSVGWVLVRVPGVSRIL
jgi:hypothetical protein